MRDEQNWEAEANYWRDRHRELVNAIEALEFGNTDHPDGLEGALQALHYEHTGARRLSPAEGAALGRWLREQGAGDVQG